MSFKEGGILIKGDCLEELRKLEENSVDALVTDPPYGWRFMGKAWDIPDVEKMIQQDLKRPPRVGSDGSIRKRGTNERALFAGTYDLTLTGNQAFQAWTEEWAREVYRVLKPGAHALIFCGPRTYHRMASGVEDAGFEVRDQIQWLFGSGFPKSHNLKDEWKGWGSALKPANEPILLARKPLEKGLTIAQNVLKWGCGAINIDASRVEGKPEEPWGNQYCDPGNGNTHGKMKRIPYVPASGRFPANLILSHNEDCEEVGVKDVKLNGSGKCSGNTASDKSIFGMKGNAVSHGNGDGTETVPAWQCSADCAVAALDAQSGVLTKGHWPKEFGDKIGFNKGGKTIQAEERHAISGGASRFFYCAKASKRERNEGCGELPSVKSGMMEDDNYPIKTGSGNLRDTRNNNHHPTVKPLKLMEYLIRMITPPNGTCLDPFLGSGSTGVAATRLGFKFIGIEREAEYMEIAKARINNE